MYICKHIHRSFKYEVTSSSFPSARLSEWVARRQALNQNSTHLNEAVQACLLPLTAQRTWWSVCVCKERESEAETQLRSSLTLSCLRASFWRQPRPSLKHSSLQRGLLTSRSAGLATAQLVLMVCLLNPSPYCNWGRLCWGGRARLRGFPKRRDAISQRRGGGVCSSRTQQLAERGSQTSFLGPKDEEITFRSQRLYY